MTSWYKDWFESELYLQIYSHRDEKDAEQLLKLILANIDLKQNADIFDCPCGNGRYSIQLARLGYNIFSMDLSNNLLLNFIKNIKNEELKVRIFRGDILNIPLKKKFDVILNLFTSFGYFDTDEKNFSFFRQSKYLLKKNGRIVFDYLNPEFVMRNIISEEKQSFGGKEIFIRRRIEDDFVIKEIKFVDSDGSHNYFEKVKLYSHNSLENHFDKIGFRVENTFGNYSGEVFDNQQSNRIIMILKT